MKLAFSFALFSLLAAPASAQSVITLDDFDFGDSEPKTQPVEKESSDSMSSCLLDPTSCEDARFKSKVTFTVDDVVNINIIDREEVAETKVSTGHEQQPASQVLPSIDLEVLFDRNSSDIRSDQYPLLLDLANVLRDGEFDNYKLVFMGHTDAKGSAEYNLTLSKQRAESVAHFVSASAGVPQSKINSVGWGFSRLADPTDPLGEVNRRVQLVLVPVN